MRGHRAAFSVGRPVAVQFLINVYTFSSKLRRVEVEVTPSLLANVARESLAARGMQPQRRSAV